MNISKTHLNQEWWFCQSMCSQRFACRHTNVKSPSWVWTLSGCFSLTVCGRLPEYQVLLTWRNAFLVLNFRLHIIDGVWGFEVKEMDFSVFCFTKICIIDDCFVVWEVGLNKLRREMLGGLFVVLFGSQASESGNKTTRRRLWAWFLTQGMSGECHC